MAEWAKVAALTEKRQQIFMTAVSAFHAGNSVVQVAAIEISIDHRLNIGPPEAILTGLQKRASKL